MATLDDLIAQLNAGRYSPDSQNIIAQVDTMVLVLQALGASLALADGHIFVGNSSNLPADVAMSGDIAITDTGATTVNKIKGATVVAGGSTLAVQTQQIFSAAGAFTWNRPAGCRLAKIRMVGGGGGGGGGGTSDGVNGTAGGDTNFDVFIAKGGGGASGSANMGGAAGTGGAGAGLSLVGSSGGGASGSSAAMAASGGIGGTSMLGGGTGQNGQNAPGAGGGGHGGNIGTAAGGFAGGGGGAAEYREILISSPLASYNGAVGAAGPGGAAGTGTGATAATNGKIGLVIVDEFY